MKCFVTTLVLLVGLAVPAAYGQSRPATPSPETAIPLQRLMLAQRVVDQLVPTAVAEAAQLQKLTTYSWNGSAWENETQTIYRYEGTNLDDETTYEWSGTAWTEASRSDYVYTNGLLASYSLEEWNGTAWEGTDLFAYEYEGGVLVRMLIRERVDGEWVDVSRTTYTVEGDHITGGQSDSLIGDSWVPYDRFTLAQEGSDVTQTYQEWDGTQWVNTDRTVYPGITLAELYDAFRTLATGFDAYSGLFIGFRLPDSIQQEWDGTQWVNTSRQVTEITHDVPGGIVLKSLLSFDSWTGEAWETDSRMEINYETVGSTSRPDTTRWQFASDGGGWMTFMEETYQYDAAGNLTTAIIQTNIGTGLQNATKIEYEYSGTGTAVDDEPLPRRYALDAAYPNPFNPATNLTYHLAQPGQIAIRVYDVLGRSIATLFEGQQTAGAHDVTFEAAGLPGGTYLIRLEAPGFLQTRTVTLLK